jgi:hypothetical protein
VACDYFQSIALVHNVRILVVLPQSYITNYRYNNINNSSSITNNEYAHEQSLILQQLQQDGYIVTAPSKDDDDAYVLMIAQREHIQRTKHISSSSSSHQQHPYGNAYVISNDLYRDAQGRDPTGQLHIWLTFGTGTNHPDTSSNSSNTGPGRISYTFCNMGRIDDHGDPIYDIVPNPRHPLIQWIEQQHSMSTL